MGIFSQEEIVHVCSNNISVRCSSDEICTNELFMCISTRYLSATIVTSCVECIAEVANVSLFCSRENGHVSGSKIADRGRSEEHTSELQSLMRISYAVFCLKKKT